MRTVRDVFCGAIVVALFIGVFPAASADTPALPETLGNLQRIDEAKADIAYKDPQADFTRYHRIMLDDLDLSNVNIVQPQASTAARGRRAWVLTDKDRESLSKAFREAMSKELTKRGYPVVGESAEDVLRISAALTDLAPAAPKDDLQSRGTGRTTVITNGAGVLAIGVVVRDSQSGEVLAIIKDSKQAGRSARLNTSVSNLAEVRRAFTGWATQLCKRLDIIHNGEPSGP